MKQPYFAGKLAVLAAIALLPGCRPTMLMGLEVQGPPNYKLGWEDGCNSGMSAIGGAQYKLMYGYKTRTEMAADSNYKTGWGEGFNYCRFTLADAQAPGQWGAIGLGEGF